MAYERHNWTCGETITEVKMNNLEDGIEEALECCGSGGGDCGYECEITNTTLYENASLEFYDDVPGYYYGDYIDPITLGADTIRLTFDGTEYFLDKFTYTANGDSYIGYGAPFAFDPDLWDFVFDFSEYPVNIQQDISVTGATVYTSESGATHSVKIESVSASVSNISPCFKEAVISASAPLVVTLDGTVGADHTYAEIIDAYNNGRTVISVYQYGSLTLIGNLSSIETTNGASFTAINYNHPDVDAYIVTVAPDNSIVIEQKTLA